eukprot:TRINITY_DN42103_c0_g4_i1.p1 TRINITY_DN42103_c0_g4~~TRINITY_DN42103_c0_g4_i1.p1  ORF type:complete len:2368 (-),score=540.07 TRINITY_DN42103_c0_g4_i1:66-7169(-)
MRGFLPLLRLAAAILLACATDIATEGQQLPAPAGAGKNGGRLFFRREATTSAYGSEEALASSADADDAGLQQDYSEADVADGAVSEGRVKQHRHTQVHKRRSRRSRQSGGGSVRPELVPGAGHASNDHVEVDLLDALRSMLRLGASQSVRLSAFRRSGIVRTLEDKYGSSFDAALLLNLVKAHPKWFALDDPFSSDPLLRCTEKPPPLEIKHVGDAVKDTWPPIRGTAMPEYHIGKTVEQAHPPPHRPPSRPLAVHPASHASGPGEDHLPARLPRKAAARRAGHSEVLRHVGRQMKKARVRRQRQAERLKADVADWRASSGGARHSSSQGGEAWPGLGGGPVASSDMEASSGYVVGDGVNTYDGVVQAPGEVGIAGALSPSTSLEDFSSQARIDWAYHVYPQSTCQGTDVDVIPDFPGSAHSCMQKCWELGDKCAGFERTIANGRCKMRGHHSRLGIEDPKPITGGDDGRALVTLEGKTVSQSFPGGGGTEKDMAWRATLGDDQWMVLSGGDLQDFGSGDFTLSLELRVSLFLDGPAAVIFSRTVDGSSEGGMFANISAAGGITFAMTQRSETDADGNTSKVWDAAECPRNTVFEWDHDLSLMFERKQRNLNIYVDGAMCVSHTMTVLPTFSNFQQADLVFFGDWQDPKSGNIEASVSHVMLSTTAKMKSLKPKFEKMVPGAAGCPPGREILTVEECDAAVQYFSYAVDKRYVCTDIPPGQKIPGIPDCAAYAIANKCYEDEDGVCDESCGRCSQQEGIDAAAAVPMWCSLREDPPSGFPNMYFRYVQKQESPIPGRHDLVPLCKASKSYFHGADCYKKVAYSTDFRDRGYAWAFKKNANNYCRTTRGTLLPDKSDAMKGFFCRKDKNMTMDEEQQTCFFPCPAPHVKTKKECAQKCNNKVGCNAFVHDSREKCWLLSEPGAIKERDGPAEEEDDYSDESGVQGLTGTAACRRFTLVASVEDCYRLCWDLGPECTGFVHWKLTERRGQCALVTGKVTVGPTDDFGWTPEDSDCYVRVAYGLDAFGKGWMPVKFEDKASEAAMLSCRSWRDRGDGSCIPRGEFKDGEQDLEGCKKQCASRQQCAGIQYREQRASASLKGIKSYSTMNKSWIKVRTRDERSKLYPAWEELQSGDFSLEGWFRLPTEIVFPDPNSTETTDPPDDDVHYLVTSHGVQASSLQRSHRRRHFRLQIERDGRLSFSLSGVGKSEGKIVTDKSLLDGEWHHIVATLSKLSSKGNLFLDGVIQKEGNLKYSGSEFEPILGSSHVHVCGGRLDGMAFPCKASHVGFWNIAMTDEHIRSCLHASVTPGLKAMYALSEDLNNTLQGAEGEFEPFSLQAAKADNSSNSSSSSDASAAVDATGSPEGRLYLVEATTAPLWSKTRRCQYGGGHCILLGSVPTGTYSRSGWKTFVRPGRQVALSFKAYKDSKCTMTHDYEVRNTLLDNYAAYPEACMAKCLELGTHCVGVERINRDKDYNLVGNCTFIGTFMDTPQRNDHGDERECYERISYTTTTTTTAAAIILAGGRSWAFMPYQGYTCSGTGRDLLVDWAGTVQECIDKCWQLTGCVGFQVSFSALRGSDALSAYGQCAFRSGKLNVPARDLLGDTDCWMRRGYSDKMSDRGVAWAFKPFQNQSCLMRSGEEESANWLLTGFAATAEDCMRKCWDLGKDCFGFIYKKSLCNFAGEEFLEPAGVERSDQEHCYPRKHFDIGGISNATKSSYDMHRGMECYGSSPDLLRGYQAPVEVCMQKCSSMGARCSGFIRINSDVADASQGGYVGKCDFKGGVMSTPQPFQADDRDCYSKIITTTTTTTMDATIVFDNQTSYKCAGQLLRLDLPTLVTNSTADCARACWKFGETCSGFNKFLHAPAFCEFYSGDLSGATNLFGWNCYQRKPGYDPPRTAPTTTGAPSTQVLTMRWTFDEFPGTMCAGEEEDLLRGYKASTSQCMQKCWDFGIKCTGIVQETQDWNIDGAIGAIGFCRFLTGAVNEPQVTEEKTTCYKRVIYHTTTTTTRLGLEDFFTLYEDQDCPSRKRDLVSDFPAATVGECQKECWRLGTVCIGFVIDNPPVFGAYEGGPKNSRCHFKQGRLKPPRGFSENPRDCYKRTAWTRTTTTTTTIGNKLGQHNYAFSFKAVDRHDCTGRDGNLISDYGASVGECMRKCWELGIGCKGFIRVKSGSSKAGRCDFRAGTLSKPTVAQVDVRTCYKRLTYDEEEVKRAALLPMTTTTTPLYRNPFAFPTMWGIGSDRLEEENLTAMPETLWRISEECQPDGSSLTCTQVCAQLSLLCKEDSLRITDQQTLNTAVESTGRFCTSWPKSPNPVGPYYADGECGYSDNVNWSPTCDAPGPCEQKRLCSCKADVVADRTKFAIPGLR